MRDEPKGCRGPCDRDPYPEDTILWIDGKRYCAAERVSASDVEVAQLIRDVYAFATDPAWTKTDAAPGKLKAIGERVKPWIDALESRKVAADV